MKTKKMKWIKSNNTTTIEGLKKEIKSIKEKIITHLKQSKGVCLVIDKYKGKIEEIDLTVDDSICVYIKLLKQYQYDLGKLMKSKFKKLAK